MLDYKEVMRELGQANGSKALRHCYERIEREILSSDHYPSGAIEVFSSVLSDPSIFNRDDISDFIFMMMSDMYAMSDLEKNKILELLCFNYSEYQVEKTCLIVCDAVARNYDSKRAFEALSNMLLSAKCIAGKRGAALGLDVVAKNSSGDAKLVGAIKSLLGRTS